MLPPRLATIDPIHVAANFNIIIPYYCTMTCTVLDCVQFFTRSLLQVILHYSKIFIPQMLPLRLATIGRYM
jgi:hypothetical protein